MGPGLTLCHRSSTSALVLNLSDINHYQLKGSCSSVPACHHVEASNHELATIIFIIVITAKELIMDEHIGFYFEMSNVLTVSSEKHKLFFLQSQSVVTSKYGKLGFCLGILLLL